MFLHTVVAILDATEAFEATEVKLIYFGNLTQTLCYNYMYVAIQW